MIQMYDHRAASVVIDETNWMRQGQTADSNDSQRQNPEFTVTPRWWVESQTVSRSLGGESPRQLLAYKDVTSPTNTRTMIAASIPVSGVANSAPIIFVHPDVSDRTQCCLLANMNSYALDFIARQKVGGVHLNFYIVEQLPLLAPDTYADRCPWNKRQTLEKWISDRVLKLTCTSNDMIPLAEACGFDPPVHKWKPSERAELMAELDAAYFLLYQIDRDDVEYILSTFSGLERAEDMFGAKGTSARILEYYDELQTVAAK